MRISPRGLAAALAVAISIQLSWAMPLLLGGCGEGGGVLDDAAAATMDAASTDLPDAATAQDLTAPGKVDPVEPGPQSVVSNDATVPDGNGAISVTTHRPSAPGTYPLVVVSPGFQMPRTQYASYAAHLASWGFVVVGQDFPPGFGTPHQALADQTRRVIDWALSAASGLASAIDSTRVGACGHSLGGKVSMLAAADDPRIRAVVGWDPVDANSPSVAPERMSQINGPVAVVGETLNGTGGFMPCAPSAENFQRFYAAASSPAIEVTLAGADHMDWVDDPSCLLCGFCTPGTLDREVVRRATRRLTAAWFRRHLVGDAAMEPYLDGPGLSAGMPTGAVAVQSK